MRPTPSVRVFRLSPPNNGVRASWKIMPEKVFGWVVTVTTPDPTGATAKVWYAACPEKVAAVEAVKLVTHDSSATIEISREMSETLMTAFGLTNGQVSVSTDTHQHVGSGGLCPIKKRHRHPCDFQSRSSPLNHTGSAGPTLLLPI